jgi:lipopolysaccharide export system permease protein
LIINRYLVREMSKPFLVTLGMLSALFASYSAASFLADAVNGLLPTDMIAILIGLKLLIAFEVLIPISLYISVVLAFGRLYSDSEFTAMSALRVTPARVMGAVLTLAGGLALGVAVLSLVVRPLAYQKMHELTGEAAVLLNIDEMAAGTFYISDHGNRAIFLAHREGPGLPASDVFVRIKQGDHMQVIYARLAFPLEPTSRDADRKVYLRDAHIYVIGSAPEYPDRVLSAQGIVVSPNSHAYDPPEYSSVAASSAALVQSSAPADVAELQWRLSTGVSTILLGMLGVPLSRTRPRQSRYAKIGTAILIYSAYYLVCTTARTWVQHGTVPSFPGIWWVPALLALAVFVALYQPTFQFRRTASGFDPSTGSHDAA